MKQKAKLNIPLVAKRRMPRSSEALQSMIQRNCSDCSTRLLSALGALALCVFTSAVSAQHPGPQPRPPMSEQITSPDGTVTYVRTSRGLFGDNGSQLPYVEREASDSTGALIPNTLPSRPGNPFNLHASPVQVASINKTSPRDDLRSVIDGARKAAADGRIDGKLLRLGIDILEGNPIPERAYSGFAMLHYTASERLKRVAAVRDSSGKVIGGNVTVHQIWFNNQVESDTALLDPSEVQDVPWTITYVVDVLNGGADDFAPFGMYFDSPTSPEPGSFGAGHFGIDQTFYPMSEGKRHVFSIKQPPARYYKLTYTWGWRKHPPRVQAMENSLQTAGGMSLLDLETSVFGQSPRATEESRRLAISQIGDISPAKRMWLSFHRALGSGPNEVEGLMADALVAYNDWSDRTKLPTGVTPDPTSDATFLFVNNTIYGNVSKVESWKAAGARFKVTLLNADHFTHAYMAVDFGGMRGWENQYQTAGGSASSHTFGRAHWWPVAGPIMVPAVGSAGELGRHRVEMELNFRPGDRVKLYQFDPLHHDVAIYSLH